MKEKIETATTRTRGHLKSMLGFAKRGKENEVDISRSQVVNSMSEVSVGERPGMELEVKRAEDEAIRLVNQFRERELISRGVSVSAPHGTG